MENMSLMWLKKNFKNYGIKIIKFINNLKLNKYKMLYINIIKSIDIKG
jgi:hypothetical protein